MFAWQFRRASNINAAFHAARQPAGPSYTAIATAIDELVAPAPGAARLEGAANIVIQDVCALRPIDHYLLTGDAVTYALVLDALTHPGPADRSRFDPTTCLQTVLPGADLAQTAVTAPVAIASAISSIATAPEVDREPALRCPFDPADCPAPQVRLTRRCAPGGALRVALAGDVDAVRSADFKLGRRLVRRAAGAPFATTLTPRTLKRAGRSRLRAVASLTEPPGGRVILARPLPRCAAQH